MVAEIPTEHAEIPEDAALEAARLLLSDEETIREAPYDVLDDLHTIASVRIKGFEDLGEELGYARLQAIAWQEVHDTTQEIMKSRFKPID